MNKILSEEEFHETLAIMAEQVSKLPTKEDAVQIVKSQTAHLPTKVDVVQIVQSQTAHLPTKDDVVQIVKSQTAHLPTKDEFYASEDRLMKELITIREEQVMMHHAFDRHEKRITRLEKHTGLEPLLSL